MADVGRVEGEVGGASGARARKIWSVMGALEWKNLERKRKSCRFVENSEIMVEVKYGLLEKVVYLNTAELRFDSDVVKDIRVIPTGISKSESGEDRLDGYEVLYQLRNGLVLSSKEVYDSEEQAKERYREALFAE